MPNRQRPHQGRIGRIEGSHSSSQDTAVGRKIEELLEHARVEEDTSPVKVGDRVSLHADLSSSTGEFGRDLRYMAALIASAIKLDL
jgi:hypothetical protein